MLAVGAGATASQNIASSPQVSAEEQAIYAAVLSSWLGPNHGKQLVDRRLGPAPSASDNAECVKGLRFAEPPSDAPKEKILDAGAFHQANIELVDGATWRPVDPEDSMGKGKSVDSAVREAFSRSLIAFSQVAFSEDGKDALVSFSMACGRLCGTGFTLQMHKSNGHWERGRQCGSYMS